MRFCEPTLASVIKNPTNQDLKYTWLGKSGMFVKAGATVTVPYDVYTAANSAQRADLGLALKGKTAQLTYKVRKPVGSKRVKRISTHVITEDGPSGKSATPPNLAKEAAAKHQAELEAKKAKEARAVARSRRALARTEIIRNVGEGKDAIEDSKDIVQKATGQKTVSMQEAMGWEPPPTNDPRQPQDIEVITMNNALSSEVGDPLEKAAAAARKESAERAAAAKLAAAKQPAVDDKAAAAKAAAAKSAGDAIAAAARNTRSEAAKKAAVTRKANRAKKEAEKAATKAEADKY